MEDLNAEIFKSLIVLNDLNLENSLIKFIEPNSFAHLKTLTNCLYLEGKRIENMKYSMFNGLSHLLNLYLHENKLKVVYDNSFIGLGQLTNLANLI